MPITKRHVQITLGILWLVDGALQLQHQMFTKAFISQVVSPAAQGQPVMVSGPMHFFSHIFLWNPVIMNSLIALTQFGLGILILIPRTVRLGLLASIFWGLFVWYIGEGLSGLLGGHATVLMGLPGAALLYGLLAWAALPEDKEDHSKAYPAAWLTFVWALVWIGGAIYQILPGQDSLADLSNMLRSNAMGAPGWMASLDRHTANAVNSFGSSSAGNTMHMTASQMAHMTGPTSPGYWFILVFALVQVLIGIGIFSNVRIRRLAIGIGIVLALMFWIVGQRLGSYFTGLATDVNTAPLLILLGGVLFAYPTLDRALAKLYTRVERLIL